MAEQRPLWRRAFDAVEREVGPRLESVVQTPGFTQAIAVMGTLQRRARREVERRTRRVLHFWNLPTGSDVKRLSEQVASVERRLRDLNKRLEER